MNTTKHYGINDIIGDKRDAILQLAVIIMPHTQWMISDHVLFPGDAAHHA